MSPKDHHGDLLFAAASYLYWLPLARKLWERSANLHID
jgi:hypothetical protein